MLQKILAIFPLIIQALSISVAKKAIDAALDVVEDAIAESKTELDDKFLLPIINLIRDLAKIPDNDPGQPSLAGVTGGSFMDKVKDLFKLLMENLSFELAQKAGDAALDVVEDAIKDSKTKLDDIFLLPLIAIIRSLAKIPDNDKKDPPFNGSVAPNSK